MKESSFTTEITPQHATVKISTSVAKETELSLI